MRTFIKFLGLALLLASLAGCTVYKAAMDERSLGQIYDDEQISFLIDKELLADKNVNYLDFKAFSYLGRVYLVGEYESESQRNRAIQIARDVEGVRSVTTYLLPKQEVANCGTTDEVRIAAELDADLLDDKSVSGTNVDTKIIQCQAILLGLVGSQAEIDRSIAIAGQVPGVTAVKSFLHVYSAH